MPLCVFIDSAEVCKPNILELHSQTGQLANWRGWRAGWALTSRVADRGPGAVIRGPVRPRLWDTPMSAKRRVVRGTEARLGRGRRASAAAEMCQSACGLRRYSPRSPDRSDRSFEVMAQIITSCLGLVLRYNNLGFLSVSQSRNLAVSEAASASFECCGHRSEERFRKHRGDGGT